MLHRILSNHIRNILNRNKRNFFGSAYKSLRISLHINHISLNIRQLGQEAITGIAGCRFGPVLAKAPGSKQFRRINTVFHSQSGHLMHIPIDKMTADKNVPYLMINSSGCSLIDHNIGLHLLDSLGQMKSRFHFSNTGPHIIYLHVGPLDFCKFALYGISHQYL